MNRKDFSLKPFPAENIRTPYALTGTLGREADDLTLRYALSGDIEVLVIPPAAATPCRQDNLWQTTCFELFIAPAHSANYWEFNLSPAGHWNVYAFDNYRQNMEVETAVTTLPFSVTRQSDALHLDLTINLKALITAQHTLHIAVCAVVHHRLNGPSYWALAHCGEKPDFHLRESFMMTL